MKVTAPATDTLPVFVTAPLIARLPLPPLETRFRTLFVVEVRLAPAFALRHGINAENSAVVDLLSVLAGFHQTK